MGWAAFLRGIEVLEIRNETPDDIAIIRALTKAAFAGKPYSSQTEAEIIDGLRSADAALLSLVAVDHDEVVGNVVFSAVTIGGVAGWVGLDPVSVRPDLQGQGVGSMLIREGLDRMRIAGAEGCVLVGDPVYYRRFGFAAVPGLGYPGVPDQYVQALCFSGPVPKGNVVFHAAFAV